MPQTFRASCFTFPRFPSCKYHASRARPHTLTPSHLSPLPFSLSLSLSRYLYLGGNASGPSSRKLHVIQLLTGVSQSGLGFQVTCQSKKTEPVQRQAITVLYLCLSKLGSPCNTFRAKATAQRGNYTADRGRGPVLSFSPSLPPSLSPSLSISSPVPLSLSHSLTPSLPPSLPPSPSPPLSLCLSLSHPLPPPLPPSLPPPSPPSPLPGAMGT